MIALLEKDLRLILIRKSTLVIYVIIGAVFTWEFSSSFSGAYLTMLGTMLGLSTLSFDDSDNCMQFLLTLPCTRKQFVVEKYLFVYGFSFVAGLVGLIIIAIASTLKGEPVNAAMCLETIATEIPILAITGGLMIPLQLKYGPEKTRLVLMVLIGAAFILGFLINSIPGMENSLANFVKMLDSMNFYSVLIIAVAVLAILTLVSILVSIKILDSKEF